MMPTCYDQTANNAHVLHKDQFHVLQPTISKALLS